MTKKFKRLAERLDPEKARKANAKLQKEIDDANNRTAMPLFVLLAIGLIWGVAFVCWLKLFIYFLQGTVI